MRTLNFNIENQKLKKDGKERGKISEEEYDNLIALK